MALLLAAILTVAVSSAIDLEGAHRIVLDGFETRTLDAEGKSQWEIRGAKAKLRGGLYDLEDIYLIVHLESGRQVDIASPRCVFDQARGIATSDAPLKVVSEEMTLEGEGYDIAAARKVLRIRSHVRMTLRKVGSHLSPADVFGDFGHPRPDDGKTAQEPRENKQ